MAILKGVDSPPGKQAVHLIADYVELMCAASVDGEYSAADFRAVRKLQEEDDSVPVEISSQELFLELEGDGDELLERIEFPSEDEKVTAGISPDEEEDVANADPGPAAEDDARVVESGDVVGHLAFRASAFQDSYPFELRDDDNLALKELNQTRKTYLFLLLASSLYALKEKTDESIITTAFELFCAHCLQAHLGDRFEVHVFGSASRSGTDRYTGSLWEKLVQLSIDLRLRLIASEEEVIENVSGDSGLDLVAWAPIGDDAPGLVIFFGQCASGAKWKGKQLEPSQQNWVNVFTFPAPLVHGILIPFCNRKVDGSWHRQYQNAQGVLIDRLRLMLALQGSAEEADRAYGEIALSLVDALLEERLA
jgi:hypothetical protein